MSQIIQIVAKRLKDYRLQRGLTQEDLAEKANLHYTYIGQVERAEKNVTINTLERIIDSLNVSFSELFTGIEQSPIENSIPRQCYDLVSSLPPDKQQIAYDLLCYIKKTLT